MTNPTRLCGGFAVALALALTATGWAAPKKPVKRHPAPVKHASPTVPKPTVPVDPAPVAPMPVTPSPTLTPGDVVFYGGSPAAATGLTLAAFGGGSVEESTEQAFTKSHSLKVTTLDDYQGATLSFTKPADLGDATDKSRFLAFTLRLGATPSSSPQAAMGGGAMMGGGGGMMAPGDGGGMMGGGGMMAPGGQGIPVAATTSLQNVHLILTLANGAQTDLLRPLPADAQTGQDQWVNVGIPLPALGLPGGGAASLKSLTIAGDDYAVLYVGQIKLTTDTTPISCFAGDQQSVAVGQPVALKGSASSGLSGLHYSWDFDSGDGISEQAEGASVTTQYLKPGEYKVTLTVSDVDGFKKPTTSTTTIRVQ